MTVFFQARYSAFRKTVVILAFVTTLFGCDFSNSSSPQNVEPMVFGLDLRPKNTSCFAAARPTEASGVTTELPFPSLNLPQSSVTSLFQKKNDLRHWYLTSRFGQVSRFENDPAVATPNLVLDLSDHVSTHYGELGLLNAIFHPQFPDDPRLFVYYIGLGGFGDANLSSFTSSDGGATFDLDSERVILTIPQITQYHKGGQLAFDEAGHLYLSIGDGGVRSRAQDPWSLYGTLIKIDIDGAEPYGIPADNPFLMANGGAPEVFAYGLRNPWRFSIDRHTGEIWLGDVGKSQWEEVDRIQSGGNYGWPIKEGAHCFDAPEGSCDSTGLIDPEFEYSHDFGIAIIGGHVYRGSAIPDLVGKYIYTDYISGVISALELDGEQVIGNDELTGSAPYITTFAEDSHGEIYIVGGQIRRLVPALNSEQDHTIPSLLSGTGCFAENDPATPLDALIPYDVNAEFWSDGAAKRRWMALPDGQHIDINADGDFLFPIGTVLIKEFTLHGKRIETRFFARFDDGSWGGYTYLWKDDQTDAELLLTGTSFLIGEQLYTIPNQNQCLQCHTEIANDALGPELSQLNRSFTYESTGRTANQLITLQHIGVIEWPLLVRQQVSDKLSRIDDVTQPIEERVRSYLHSNCSQCHRPGGVDRTTADFRYTAPDGMGVCDVIPQIDDFGIENARLIAPGDPDRSIVLVRLSRIGHGQMPPIARNVPHTKAIDLLTDYIAGLESCD